MTTVADRIVGRLIDAGAGAIFGIPGGGSSLDLIDAAGRRGLPFVLTATETGAAIAAIGYSEASGSPGVCLTTLGPGVSSVVNGVACASLERAALVVITDCHPASAAAFAHQRLDHRALLTPVTKWSGAVTADNVDAAVDEALDRALAQPPGPVHLDLAPDVARATAGAWPPARKRWQQAPLMVSEDRSVVSGSALAALLGKARRPLLLVGLGARCDADRAAVRALCASRGVPALVTYKAKGVVADADPHFAGILTNAAIEGPILDQADLFIGVGLDPVELIPRPWARAAPIVNCARRRVEGRHVEFAEQIVGDVSVVLAQIEQMLTASTWDLERIQSVVRSQRTALRTLRDGALTPASAIETAARVCDRARVTVDAGAHMFPATTLWPIDRPNGMLISNGLSTMGFALPAAIGAATADRVHPVVALTGDGGLLMCAGELSTAARERLRIVTVVLNDAALSLIAIKQQQRRLAPDGVALGPIRWSTLADSVGVAGHTATDEPQLERALSAALAHDGPSLIDVRVDPASYRDVLENIRGV
jgi:acetolactate synthase I/II/III large subunit